MQDVHRYRRPIQRWGVPFDVLTDNGKQFTGKLARPLRIEVLFERTCREYGITRPPDQTAITVPRTRGYTHTNGKIEQFHRTLRRELLDEVGAFATIEAADRDRRMDSRLQHAPPSSVVGHGTPASLFRARQDEEPTPASTLIVGVGASAAPQPIVIISAEAHPSRSTYVCHRPDSWTSLVRSRYGSGRAIPGVR